MRDEQKQTPQDVCGEARIDGQSLIEVEFEIT